jgi:hypothetical protein
MKPRAHAVRKPAVRGRAILNLVSMAAGDCAGDEKPQRSTPETENDKETADRNGCCLFRGVMIVARKDDVQTLHDLS